MGMIAPKKLSAGSKTLITFLVIILSPLLILAIFIYFVWGALLYSVIWFTHKKPFVVFIHSDSPTWKHYIETEILPYIQDRAVILNWSERRNWKNSLAVLAFRYFGGHRNFNPIGIVIPPFRFIKTYRFFEAFKERKHGNLKKVESLKEELFKILGV